MTTALASEVIDQRPMAALEPLVDRVIAAVFGSRNAGTERISIAQAIHEARGLRRTGRMDDALLALSDADVTNALLDQRRWLYNEWLDIVRRRYRRGTIVVYTQGDGRAAALEQVGHGDLKVVAVLGMKWWPGKMVSRRSLRGLKDLQGRPL